jgi:predicted RNA polymerase sigma factor
MRIEAWRRCIVLFVNDFPKFCGWSLEEQRIVTASSRSIAAEIVVIKVVGRAINRLLHGVYRARSTFPTRGIKETPTALFSTAGRHRDYNEYRGDRDKENDGIDRGRDRDPISSEVSCFWLLT